MSFIRLENVSFDYQNKGFRINDVTLGLDLGSITVLCGKNGSGKTTLSKLMMGILKPCTGHVLVNGSNIEKQSLAKTAKDVGYLFQNPERQLFCLTVLDEIAFSLKYNREDARQSHQKAKELLERFFMSDKANEYPLRLSGGEKQRLALLAVFAIKPKFFILDEPTTGLDKQNKDRLFAILKDFKAQGAGICIITHDKTLIERLSGQDCNDGEGKDSKR